MSYCVNIKTSKRLEANAIFDEFVSRGERIIITSDKFPSLKFGTFEEALRGIEINKEDDGFEIRVCSFSSIEDYRLFTIAIDVLMGMTSAIAYTEERELITNPYTVFSEQWVDKQIESSLNVIRVLAKHSGTAIVMYGLFQPFCVGPYVLRSFGVNLYGSNEDYKSIYKKLTEYLVRIQWNLSDATDTHSRLALPNPENPDEEPLEISLIAIKDNKVNHFDFVSYSPLLAISNMDTDEMVIVHFEDFQKTTNRKNHLACIDEWQMRTCSGEPSVEEIKELMEIAKRYMPENLHYRPTYPGFGYDEKQKTFVLMWNPESSETTLEEHISHIRNLFADTIRERIHNWKEARMGDRFYLIRTGEGNTGVVMTGVFGSQPFISPEWSGKGRKTYVIELKPNMILNPETIPMLTTNDLENTIPDFMWRGGYSGRLLTEEQAKSLETLFSRYFESIEDKDDGINLCITRKNMA